LSGDIMAKYYSTLEEPMMPQLKRMVFRALNLSQDVVG
jgi:hypothetical protein